MKNTRSVFLKKKIGGIALTMYSTYYIREDRGSICDESKSFILARIIITFIKKGLRLGYALYVKLLLSTSFPYLHKRISRLGTEMHSMI